jgi:hypothetical protein
VQDNSIQKLETIESAIEKGAINIEVKNKDSKNLLSRDYGYMA